MSAKDIFHEVVKIAAERNGEKIAVAIKSFLGASAEVNYRSQKLTSINGNTTIYFKTYAV